MPAITKTSQGQNPPFQLAHANANPLLDALNQYVPTSSGVRIGRAIAIAAQKKSWTSNGMFRIVSMYTLEILLTIQMLERRPIPIRTPRTVAARMPVIATRSVLMAPTVRARIPLSGDVSIPSRRSIPVGSVSQSQPKDTPESAKLAKAWLPRIPINATTTARVTIWANHLRNVAFRHFGTLSCLPVAIAIGAAPPSSQTQSPFLRPRRESGASRHSLPPSVSLVPVLLDQRAGGA